MTSADSVCVKNKNIHWWFVWIIFSELVFLIFFVKYFESSGYAMPPFFFAPLDTFMDFYNTNYWSLNDGRYDIWQSIYPISVFALAQMLVPDYCASVVLPAELRDCTPYSIAWLFLFYFCAIFVCTKLIVKQVGIKYISVEIVIFLALLMQFPGLYALERGNYIIVAFMLLAFSQAFGANWKGAVFLALAINIKQYLIVLWFVPFFKREYTYFLISFFASLLINKISMIVLEDGNYRQIFENMFSFSGAVNSDFFQKVWYTTSLSSWSKAVFYYQDRIPVILYLTAHFLRWFVLFVAASILFLSARKAHFFTWEQLSVVVLLSMMVATDSPGGYAVILLLPYLSAILIGSYANKYRRIIMFVLLIPLDFVVGPIIEFNQFSFLSQHYVDVSTGLTFGAYIRPFCLLFMLIIMSYPVLVSLRKFS